MTEIVSTDPSTSELKTLAEYGQAKLGAADSIAPLSFLDFDENGDPREIKMTIRTSDMIGGTDTIGESAKNRAKASYNGMKIKDRILLRGMLGTDETGVKQVLAEQYARELVESAIRGKDSFTVTDDNTIKIGKTNLSDVTINGEAGQAKTKLKLKDTPKTGFWGLALKE